MKKTSEFHHCEIHLNLMENKLHILLYNIRNTIVDVLSKFTLEKSLFFRARLLEKDFCFGETTGKNK